MKRRKYWEIGGFLAGGLLIVFGVVAIFMGVNGYNTTRDAIKGEGIAFGTADDPAVAKYAEQWAGQQVKTGDQARAFAKVMRMHTLEVDRRPHLCVDGPLPVGCEAHRPGGHERRGRSGQGRDRSADRERRPQHLGDRDGAHDCAERELHGRAARGLRDRRRNRAPADGPRARDLGLRGLRPRAQGRDPAARRLRLGP